MSDSDRLELYKQLEAVEDEVLRATAIHGPMRSAHEGHSIIQEEFEEMWDEIKKNDLTKAREECVQLAAMAVRFLVDVK